MITLNILPLEKRKEIKLTLVYITLKNVIIIVLLYLICVAIALLVSKALLQNHFNRVVEETTLLTRQSNLFTEEMKIFNRDLENILLVQKQHVAWPNFFAAFSGLVPENISLKSIAISRTEKNGDQIELTGLARDRADLLALQQQLTASALFSNIDVPLSSLLQQTQVDFSIKATLNLDVLEQHEN